MLNEKDTVMVLVDVQGKLARMVQGSEAMIKNLESLMQSLQILEIPIIWLEQYPEGLGATIEELAHFMAGMKPIRKTSFSAYKNEAFAQAVNATGRRQVVIAGIETHICVYQTSIDLVASGYEVHVVTDAVASRTEANKEIGLDKMRRGGVILTSVETALFELMKNADGNRFKQIVSLLK